MMSLKIKLTEFLHEISPKQYTRKLSSNATLLQEVLDATSQYITPNLVERIYILLVAAPVVNACGKLPLFKSYREGYRTYCGSRSVCVCSKEAHSSAIKVKWAALTDADKAERTNAYKTTFVKTHGVENPMHLDSVKEKVKATNQTKYGVDYPLLAEEVQQKIKATNQSKYGVDYPLSSKVVQDTVRASTMERYGTLMGAARAASYAKFDGKNPFQDSEIKEKILATQLEKYNNRLYKQSHLTDIQLSILKDKLQLEAILSGKSLKTAAYEIGVNETTVARYCDYYNLRDVLGYKESTNEYKIRMLLDSLNIEYVVGSKKIIAPLQLDFYLPKLNVAIEVGSIYFHSEINSKRDKKYHYTKWQRCKELGIELYQWFDDELNTKWQVIENKIRYLGGAVSSKIGARKIMLSDEVGTVHEKQFLIENHIQGFVSDRTLTIGGYYQSQLVAVMNFKVRASQIELTRFATKLGATYPGLFTKMLKYARTKLPLLDIISFSANCHSSGKVYKSSGFEFSHNVEPTYFYTKDYHFKLARNQFMKSKLLKKYPTLDSTKTEWELMQELGYDRIWDAGKVAWIMKA